MKCPQNYFDQNENRGLGSESIIIGKGRVCELFQVKYAGKSEFENNCLIKVGYKAITF